MKALVPAIKNKIIISIDENGILDNEFYGLINWSNIISIEKINNNNFAFGGVDTSHVGISLKTNSIQNDIRIELNQARLNITWLAGNSNVIFDQIMAHYNHYKSS